MSAKKFSKLFTDCYALPHIIFITSDVWVIAALHHISSTLDRQGKNPLLTTQSESSHTIDYLSINLEPVTILMHPLIDTSSLISLNYLIFDQGILLQSATQMFFLPNLNAAIYSLKGFRIRVRPMIALNQSPALKRAAVSKLPEPLASHPRQQKRSA